MTASYITPLGTVATDDTVRVTGGGNGYGTGTAETGPTPMAVYIDAAGGFFILGVSEGKLREGFDIRNVVVDSIRETVYTSPVPVPLGVDARAVFDAAGNGPVTGCAIKARSVKL